jgi:hypothetical protein
MGRVEPRRNARQKARRGKGNDTEKAGKFQRE